MRAVAWRAWLCYAIGIPRLFTIIAVCLQRTWHVTYENFYMLFYTFYDTQTAVEVKTNQPKKEKKKKKKKSPGRLGTLSGLRTLCGPPAGMGMWCTYARCPGRIKGFTCITSTLLPKADIVNW
ncbi:hypothetical protein GGR50DRAFT_344216 [Xylaria sp. CBS 124048]|nr:hypothetical protein GGR50DRAFT_344216 [Xylaria sp. CBS 124048]